MRILVTGGTGYIGSHTCVELLKEDNELVIADNLSNSTEDVVLKIEEISGKKICFHKIDVSDEIAVFELFRKYNFEAVIHFAGFKAVGESVEKPLLYYQNNLLSTIVLCKACLKYNANKFVFSSSATVYGDNVSPFIETMPLLPTTNPYGETKAMSERILSDTAKINENFKVTILRYFNPVGAHESGLIGEKPCGIPNNLMPFITQTAKGVREKLYVFGNDYSTVDGTGVRDYIHVVDLAKGHVKALKNQISNINIYNLGTGQGTSVLQLIHAFEKVNNLTIPYEITQRRAGDIASCFASADKAKNELNWYTEKNIDDMCKDAWKFEKKN